jgi:signal transduction histidine kinase
MRLIKLFLFVLIFLLFNNTSRADELIIFKDDAKTLNIGSRVGVFSDATNSLSLNDVLQLNEFNYKNVNTPNLAISRSTHWVKLKVQNQSNIKKLVLELEYPIIDEIIFYSKNISGTYDSVLSGEIRKYSARQIDNQNYLFYLNFDHEEVREFYLKVRSGEQVQLPLILGTQKEIFEELIVKDLVFGLYLGIILVMAIYNLFIYITVRDRSYLYYVSYIIFVGLTQVVLQGYGFKYLWPNSVWMVMQSTFLVPVLNGWTAILFVKNFLNTKENYKRGDTILNVIFFFYTICLVLSLLEEFYWAQNLVQVTALVGSVLTIHIAYAIGKRGYRPAIYFLIAWSIFLISIVVFVLRNFNILPYNDLTYYALQIGSATEVTLLSFALADKINIYRKEKEASQAEALRISLENERIIKEQNILLEVKVEERTRDLNQSNIDLNIALDDLKNAQTKLVDAEKMASLGQLTAGIAHEINNPINFVSSNIRPLRRDIDDIIDLLNKIETTIKEKSLENEFEEAKKFKNDIDYDYLIQEIDILLKGMSDGAGRTVDIVKGLKSFSRLDESDLKFANVNEGLDSTVIILNSTFKGKVAVVKNFGDIPEIECFAGKLNQVFMNIINNAAQAVITSHENDNEGKVVIKTFREDKFIKISISDNGTGIPEEVKQKIFEPFFTTKKAGEGTGLGLSIVYSIIELHKGNIEVHSELGRGTEFLITLPINQ